jgi:hypothetical protein
MSVEVLKLSGDYKVATASAGTITLDTGVTTGTVIITGNLDVRGRQTYIESTDSTIKDNILVLNKGETTGRVSLDTSGLAIDRSTTSTEQYATLLWDETQNWNTPLTSNAGLFTLKKGTDLTAIKVNGISFDGYGADGDGRFYFATNGGVLSVTDAGYTARVINPNDIPNKEYVDNVPFSGTATSALVAKKLANPFDGNSWIEINDDQVTGLESNITAYVNSVTTFVIRPNQVVFSSVRISGSEIESLVTNTNLTLKTNGTGVVVVQNGVAFQAPVFPTWAPPNPAIGQTNVYSTSSVGAGSTGLLFNHTDGVNTVSGELVSARKALIFGIIF